MPSATPRESSRTKTNIFDKSIPVGGQVGPVLVVSDLSDYQQFWYPSYGPSREEGKFSEFNAHFNLASRAIFRNSTGWLVSGHGSEIERKVLEVYMAMHKRVCDKAAERQIKFDDQQIHGFGPSYLKYGGMMLVNGNVQPVELKETDYKRLFRFLNQVEGDRLVITPLAVPIVFTKKLSDQEYGFGKNKKKVEEMHPSAVLTETSKKFTRLLSASFYNCFICHPDDAGELNKYVKGKIEKALFGGDIDWSDAPTYRNYPDVETGKVAYVSQKAAVDFVVVSLLDAGVPKEVLQKIAEQRRAFEFMTSTEHSLLGGWYYEENGIRIPVAEQFLRDSLKTMEFDGDGNPLIVNKKGEKVPVLYLEGKLWKNPLSPFNADKDDPTRMAFTEAQLLFETAVKLGVPVLDESRKLYPNKPEPVDWKGLLNRPNLTVSENIPAASL